jgi:hypothetical protein
MGNTTLESNAQTILDSSIRHRSTAGNKPFQRVIPTPTLANAVRAHLFNAGYSGNFTLREDPSFHLLRLRNSNCKTVCHLLQTHE